MSGKKGNLSLKIFSHRPPIKVFYSYSQKDQSKMDALEKRLVRLRRENLIQEWHANRITAGVEREREINQQLESADIIILLVSSDFLDYDYFSLKLMTRAMERHQEGSARVIPIILRTCNWIDEPFGKLQPLPKGGKPIKNWPDQDKVLTEIAKEIRIIVEKWLPASKMPAKKKKTTPRSCRATKILQRGSRTIPYYVGVRASWLSFVDDTPEDYWDVPDQLLSRSQETFLVRVCGHSMIDKGINEGDVLIVEKVNDPSIIHNGAVILAVVNNESVVKEYQHRGSHVELIPASKTHSTEYQARIVTEYDKFEIRGIVKFVIHKFEPF